jgi:hypothetical protein
MEQLKLRIGLIIVLAILLALIAFLLWVTRPWKFNTRDTITYPHPKFRERKPRIDELDERARAIEQEIKRLMDEARILADEALKRLEEARILRDELDKLKEELDKIKKDMDDAKKRLFEATTDEEKLKAYNEIEQGYKDAENKMKEIEAKYNELESKLNESQSLANEANSKLRAVDSLQLELNGIRNDLEIEIEKELKNNKKPDTKALLEKIKKFSDIESQVKSHVADKESIRKNVTNTHNDAETMKRESFKTLQDAKTKFKQCLGILTDAKIHMRALGFDIDLFEKAKGDIDNAKKKLNNELREEYKKNMLEEQRLKTKIAKIEEGIKNKRPMFDDGISNNLFDYTKDILDTLKKLDDENLRGDELDERLKQLNDIETQIKKYFSVDSLANDIIFRNPFGDTDIDVLKQQLRDLIDERNRLDTVNDNTRIKDIETVNSKIRALLNKMGFNLSREALDSIKNLKDKLLRLNKDGAKIEDDSKLNKLRKELVDIESKGYDKTTDFDYNKINPDELFVASRVKGTIPDIDYPERIKRILDKIKNLDDFIKEIAGNELLSDIFNEDLRNLYNQKAELDARLELINAKKQAYIDSIKQFNDISSETTSRIIKTITSDTEIALNTKYNDLINSFSDIIAERLQFEHKILSAEVSKLLNDEFLDETTRLKIRDTLDSILKASNDFKKFGAYNTYSNIKNLKSNINSDVDIGKLKETLFTLLGEAKANAIDALIKSDKMNLDSLNRLYKTINNTIDLFKSTIMKNDNSLKINPNDTKVIQKIKNEGIKILEDLAKARYDSYNPDKILQTQIEDLEAKILRDQRLLDADNEERLKSNTNKLNDVIDDVNVKNSPEIRYKQSSIDFTNRIEKALSSIAEDARKGIENRLNDNTEKLNKLKEELDNKVKMRHLDESTSGKITRLAEIENLVLINKLKTVLGNEYVDLTADKDFMKRVLNTTAKDLLIKSADFKYGDTFFKNTIENLKDLNKIRQLDLVAKNLDNELRELKSKTFLDSVDTNIKSNKKTDIINIATADTRIQHVAAYRAAIINARNEKIKEIFNKNLLEDKEGNLQRLNTKTTETVKLDPNIPNNSGALDTGPLPEGTSVINPHISTDSIINPDEFVQHLETLSNPPNQADTAARNILQNQNDIIGINKLQDSLIELGEGMKNFALTPDIEARYYGDLVTKGISSLSVSAANKFKTAFSTSLNISRLRWLSTCIYNVVKLSDDILSGKRRITPLELDDIKKKINNNTDIDDITKTKLNKFLDDNHKLIPRSLRDFQSITFVTYQENVIAHDPANLDPNPGVKTITEPIEFIIRVKGGQQMVIRPNAFRETPELTKKAIDDSLNNIVGSSENVKYSILRTNTTRGAIVLSNIDIELAKKSRSSEDTLAEFKEWKKNNRKAPDSAFPGHKNYVSDLLSNQNANVVKNGEALNSIWNKVNEQLPSKYLLWPYKEQLSDGTFRVSPDILTYAYKGLIIYNNWFEKAYSYKLFNKPIVITNPSWGRALGADVISAPGEPYVAVIHHTAGMYLMTSMDIALLTIQIIEASTKTYHRTRKQYGTAVAKTGLGVSIAMNTLQTVVFWFMDMAFISQVLGVYMGLVGTLLIIDQVCQLASMVSSTFYEEEEENHDITNVMPSNLQSNDQEDIISGLTKWMFYDHYISNSDFDNINRVVGIKGQLVDTYGYAGSTGNLPSNLSGPSGPKIDPNAYYYYQWDRLTPVQMLEIVNNKNDNYNYVYTKTAKKAIVDFVMWNCLKSEDELQYITYDEYNMYLDSFERGCHKFIFDGQNFQYIHIKPNLSGSPSIWRYRTMDIVYDCEDPEKYFILNQGLTNFYTAFEKLCIKEGIDFTTYTTEPGIINFDDDNKPIITCYSPNMFISLCKSIVNSENYDFTRLILYEKGITELIVDFLNYNYAVNSITTAYTIAYKLINMNNKIIKTSYYFKIKTDHGYLIDKYSYSIYGSGVGTKQGSTGGVDGGTLLPATVLIIDSLKRYYDTLAECILNIHTSYLYTPQMLIAKAYLYYGLNGYSLSTDLADAFISTFKSRMRTISQIFTNYPLDKDKYVYGSDSYCTYIESKLGNTALFEIPLFPIFYDGNEHNIRYVDVTDEYNNLGIDKGPKDYYRTNGTRGQAVFYRKVKESEWIRNLTYFLSAYSYYIRHPDDDSPEIMDLQKIHQGRNNKGSSDGKNSATNKPTQGQSGASGGVQDINTTQEFSINYNGINKGLTYLINAQRGFFYYMRTSVENKIDLLNPMYTLCFLKDVQIIYNIEGKLNWNMDILSNHIAMGQLLLDNSGKEIQIPIKIDPSTQAIKFLNTNDPIPVVANDSQDTIFDYYTFKTNNSINGKEIIIDTKEKNAIMFGPKWIERIVKYIGSYNDKESNKDIKEISKKYIIGFSIYNDTDNNRYDATFYTRIDEEENEDESSGNKPPGLFVSNKTKNYVLSYYRVSNLDYTLLKSMIGKIYSLTVYNCQWTAFIIANIIDPSTQMFIAQNIKIGPMSQLTLHYLIKDQFIPNDDSIIFQFRFVGEFIALKKTRLTNITYNNLVRDDGILNRYMVAYYGGGSGLIVTSADNIVRAILTDNKKKYKEYISRYTVTLQLGANFY